MFMKINKNKGLNMKVITMESSAFRSLTEQIAEIAAHVRAASGDKKDVYKRQLWDTKGGRVTGRSAAALETNRMLDKMRVRINRHYQEIMERDNFVTAEKVKNAFLGLEHRYHTLMQVFRRHNENYEKQVEAGMKAKGTLEKYRVVYKHLQEFLDIRYHVKDIALKELTPAFISDFEMFLRTDKHRCV